MALVALRHAVSSAPIGDPVIGYLEFVKTGEQQAAHEVHEPQSHS